MRANPVLLAIMLVTGLGSAFSIGYAYGYKNGRTKGYQTALGEQDDDYPPCPTRKKVAVWEDTKPLKLKE